MRKLILITSSVIAFTGLAYGQSYTFRVLANKGQNQIQKSGVSSPNTLKTGATLSSGDELIASKGAYIAMMHKSGRTLEVRTPGRKKVSELEKQINVKSESVSSRYAKFLANKLNEKENINYRERLNATGAVDRGTEGTIHVLLPKEVNVLNNKAIITWITPEGLEKNDYVVSIKNIFGDKIHEEVVSGSAFNLDFTSKALKENEELFIVSVVAKDNDKLISNEVGIKKLVGEDASGFQSSLKKLQSEASEDSPISKIVFASFYEENGLILDALTEMEKVISANPEVADFEELKKDILERNGIKIFSERNEK